MRSPRFVRLPSLRCGRLTPPIVRVTIGVPRPGAVARITFGRTGLRPGLAALVVRLRRTRPNVIVDLGGVRSG